MEESQPRIAIEQVPDGVRVRLLGRWNAGNLAARANLQALQDNLGALPRP